MFRKNPPCRGIDVERRHCSMSELFSNLIVPELVMLVTFLRSAQTTSSRALRCRRVTVSPIVLKLLRVLICRAAH